MANVKICPRCKSTNVAINRVSLIDSVIHDECLECNFNIDAKTGLSVFPEVDESEVEKIQKEYAK